MLPPRVAYFQCFFFLFVYFFFHLISKRANFSLSNPVYVLSWSHTACAAVHIFIFILRSIVNYILRLDLHVYVSEYVDVCVRVCTCMRVRVRGGLELFVDTCLSSIYIFSGLWMLFGNGVTRAWLLSLPKKKENVPCKKLPIKSSVIKIQLYPTTRQSFQNTSI